MVATLRSLQAQSVESRHNLYCDPGRIEMNQDTEICLIDELRELKEAKSAFLDEAVAWNPLSHYTSAAHFQQELTNVLRALPLVIGHSSELQGSGAFLQREAGGVPVLVTRDASGQVNAFVNVCRHRGTRLVDEEAGCKHRFSCPYHAWTYANTGELLAAPQFEQGFPDEDKVQLGLRRLPCQERFGFIWVIASPHAAVDLNAYFEGLGHDLDALGIDQMAIAQEYSEVRRANWKVLIEGGLEAYHFKVAHRTTIGPHFENNLSSYQVFGPHLRSILPRTSMARLSPEDKKTWRLRDHANIIYTLFPTCQLLVQQDHVVWITLQPLAAGETRLRLVTLAPADRLHEEEHWRRNHMITRTTLTEDFVIGESIQAGTISGANDSMLFGRYEGALDQFNRTVQRFLEEGRKS